MHPPELPAITAAPWQPLPPRGATFAAIGGGIGMALILGIACGVLARVLHLPHAVLAAIAGAIAGASIGAWFGWRRHRRTFWRLDAHALGVRRGHLWHSESRVPVARVQHLDLQRGPLQRAAGLATLIVHTAGTRMNTVAIAGLAVDDAERLRDTLARQLDHDDAL